MEVFCFCFEGVFIEWSMPLSGGIVCFVVERSGRRVVGLGVTGDFVRQLVKLLDSIERLRLEKERLSVESLGLLPPRVS